MTYSASIRLAPAKVNLFLHVGAVNASGYHPIHSLMMFATVGDSLRFDGRPPMRFMIEGPFAEGLRADPGNLVVRARDAVLAAAGVTDAAFGLTLHKALPIASGVGGGSSDAAAAMLVTRDVLGLEIDEAAFQRIALDLGSDVPACLRAEPVIATGRGEILTPAPPIPLLPAVLVNPRIACPTGPVFRAYDQAVAAEGASGPPWPERLSDIADVVQFLAACRNDLQAPAIALQPVIGEVLAHLADQPETLFSRMSGSGATCFALCADKAATDALAARLGVLKPDWWVQPCALANWPLFHSHAR